MIFFFGPILRMMGWGASQILRRRDQRLVVACPGGEEDRFLPSLGETIGESIPPYSYLRERRVESRHIPGVE
jgi:hypothetical protein